MICTTHQPLKDDQMKDKTGGACKLSGTKYGSRNSAVGIEVRLRAGRSGVRIPTGDSFSTRSRPAVGSTHWVPRLFRGNKPARRHAARSPPTRVEVKSQWLYTFIPPIRQHGVVLDKFTFYLDNSLVCFLFTFEEQYRSIGSLFKCKTLGQSVTSQWTLIRKIHHSGQEVDQQETRLGKHVALETTRAARVLKHFRKTYRPRFQFCGIQNRGH